MTKFLASVSSLDEAAIALGSGADIIDLKNPEQGALGALPLPLIRQVVEMVAGRRPVSATIGDLPMQPGLIADAVRQTADTGVDIVKIGMFGSAGHGACIDALAPFAMKGVRIVAVLFADQAPDFGLLPRLAKSGFHGAMLDTASKTGRRLTQHLSPAELQDFVTAAQRLRLLSGLAGSLAEADIAPLVHMRPDYLGFRGALCQESDRKAVLDPLRLARIGELLYSCNIDSMELA